MNRLLQIVFILIIGTRLGHAEGPIEEEIRRRILAGVAVPLKLKVHGYSAKEIDTALSGWYSDRSFAPFWIEKGSPSTQAHEIVTAIEESERDGLNPDDYFLSAIKSHWERRELSSMAELDLLLTLGAGHLAADARAGRVEPRAIDETEFEGVKLELPDFGATLKALIQRRDIGEALREQFPQHRQYTRLKNAVAHYRKILANGGWKSISAGPPLKPGSSGPRIQELARRLEISGDLEPNSFKGDKFDTELAVAIKSFQLRHGIPTTGEVHEQTMKALNVPIEERLKTLIINLERWRWLDRKFAEKKEVFVNIAGFELFALDGANITLRLPVIVGKAFHATPIFSALIGYIEFNPYWNVPPSIAANETLPQLKSDPNYLQKQHMRLFERSSMKEIVPNSVNWRTVTKAQMNRYFVRQEHGEWNVLGALKFVFPNPHSVYLHDTGTRGLFSERQRALSHGCIRVQDPERLAAFLLDTPEDPWSIDRVKSLIATGKNQNIKLAEKVPLHLTYRTAWVDLDQTVNFRPDIYQRDEKIASVLKP